MFLGFIDRSESNSRIRPNQGIRQSAANAVRLGPLLGILIAGVSGPILIRNPSIVSPNLYIGILILGCLFTGVTLFGGLTVAEHYLLRWLLHIHRLLPFRIIAFMETMRDRILIQRVGGHYRFIHRTFQEHVAALTDERIAELTAVQRVP